jgi:hypothetical protein
MRTSNLMARAILPIVCGLVMPHYSVQSAESGQAVESRTMVHTRDVGLAEMTRKAKTIFSGKVQHVSTESIDLGGGRSQPIQVVTFRIEQVKKGDLKPGDTPKFRLSPVLDVPIREGEELVWYLPGPSRLGLVAPIGIHSGFFRIRSAKLADNSEIKLAENLKRNQGLYPPGVDISPNEVRVAAGRVPEVDGAEKIMQSFADKASKPGPVPLSLIFATTEKLLKE